jgi:hypothetical protein
MSIDRINPNLPTTDKIEDLNDQTVELDGRTYQAQFDKGELDSLYSGSGLQRKFIRDQSLSTNTGAGAWYNWNHVKAEAGYSIWRFDGSLNLAYNAADEFYFDEKLVVNKGQASSEDITSFDSVQVYDGSSYTDRTAEAASEGGTSFDLLADTGDYLYIGHSATFKGIDFNFDTRAANYTILIEYNNTGSGWSTLATNEYTVTDGTSDGLQILLIGQRRQ